MELNKYFKQADAEILINEAYDHLMDTIEELVKDEDKKTAYTFLANREYIECFDFLWKAERKEYDTTNLGWALRNFYEYEKRMACGHPDKSF